MPRSDTLAATAALSTLANPADAAAQACEMLCDGVSGSIDLVLAFFSAHHADDAADIARAINNRIGPACLLGSSAQSVIATSREVEAGPGIALLGLSLPGVDLVPFTFDEIQAVGQDDPASLREVLGIGPDHRATLLLADPFSVPIVGLLPRLNEALAGVPLIGGMASAGDKSGQNALVLNDRVLRAGAVGLSIRGPIRVDPVVSQGCKPFGPTMVVTASSGNLIQRLDGVKALDAIEDALSSLGAADRLLLEHGLCLGRAIDPDKPRLGRDDFLVRHVVGVDPVSRAIAIDDVIAPGETIRLHLRDRDTARSDLAMLLDGQQLRETPFAAMLISCNGRGRALFGEPDCDARAVARAFGSATPGESVAHGGTLIAPDDTAIPLAGFFANGEIGPIAGQSFLHSQTASLALFRQPDPSEYD